MAYQPLSETCASVVKRFSATLFLILLISLWVDLPRKEGDICFYSTAYGDDLKYTIKRAINQAKHSIHVESYGLGDKQIRAHLVSAAKKGLKVTARFDKKSAKPLPSPVMNYPTKVRGLMHRKMVIIDKSLVFLGSANLTAPSLVMHRNHLVGLYNKELAAFLLDPESNTYKDSLYLLPNKHAITPLVEALDGAKSTLDVAMFTLTHEELVKALIRAHKRGVKTTVHLSKNTSYKAANALASAGIPIKYPLENVLCHHKWALIDKETFIFGSANWTKAAFERNQDYYYIITIPKCISYKIKP